MLKAGPTISGVFSFTGSNLNLFQPGGTTDALITAYSIPGYAGNAATSVNVPIVDSNFPLFATNFGGPALGSSGATGAAGIDMRTSGFFRLSRLGFGTNGSAVASVVTLTSDWLKGFDGLVQLARSSAEDVGMPAARLSGDGPLGSDPSALAVDAGPFPPGSLTVTFDKGAGRVRLAMDTQQWSTTILAEAYFLLQVSANTSHWAGDQRPHDPLSCTCLFPILNFISLT